MRGFFRAPSALFFAAVLFALPAAAQERGRLASTAEAASTPAERLDRLFGELKRERNEKAADRIVASIWREWLNSGSATIDLMTKWSNDAVAAKRYAAALDFLDQVIALQPDYAEGWNRRATVHFLMGDYARSMADIRRTLQLEPRHFGALSGMAQILEATGRNALALD